MQMKCSECSPVMAENYLKILDTIFVIANSDEQ